MSGNELIGNVAEVVADDLRLRADSQNIVANTLDESSLPARGDGAESILGVAGNEAELGGLGTKLLLDITVRLA